MGKASIPTQNLELKIYLDQQVLLEVNQVILKSPKNNLSIATIGAILDDFDFDIKLRTVSFKFKVPGQATISVNGNKLDNKAKTALRRAKVGSNVQIFDIKVQNPSNPSYRFKKVSPVICELVN